MTKHRSWRSLQEHSLHMTKILAIIVTSRSYKTYTYIKCINFLPISGGKGQNNDDLCMKLMICVFTIHS